MIEIIPAIMPQSLDDLADKAGLVAPYVHMIQLDIMDGRFVKSKTWPYYASDYSFDTLISEDEGLPLWDKVDYEVDLMIEKPETVIDDWITAGAKRLIIHVESTAKMPDIVRQFRQRFAYSADPAERDVEFILAIGLETSVDALLPYLEDIDGVQFMGIAHIGLQGQPLDERILDRMREFHNAHPEIMISVDGGVTLDNAHLLHNSGARRLVSGSAIYESTNIAETIDLFKNT
jgi:ribulose-phosphate 3-epimerase